MDEYEDWGRRADLTLVALYWIPERFVQGRLKWCDCDSYQPHTDLYRKPGMYQVKEVIW